MLSPKYNYSPGSLATPKFTPGSPKDSNMEIDSVNPLKKLHQQELLPELFTVLHQLQCGKILAKDFDNHMGGLRLKLDNIKQYLREIPGITESIEDREETIESLEKKNKVKLELLNEYGEKMSQGQ